MEDSLLLNNLLFHDDKLCLLHQDKFHRDHSCYQKPLPNLIIAALYPHRNDIFHEVLPKSAIFDLSPSIPLGLIIVIDYVGSAHGSDIAFTAAWDPSDFETFRALVEAHEKDIAAVVLEPEHDVSATAMPQTREASVSARTFIGAVIIHTFLWGGPSGGKLWIVSQIIPKSIRISRSASKKH